LALATLPVVGIQTWKDWLEVGNTAAAHYEISPTWNSLSRDTQGIVRRYAIDFDRPEEARGDPLVNRVCWGILLSTVLITSVVYLTRADRRNAWGLGAAFAFFGAYLSCYRFMYYDALLAGVGWVCLFADRSGWQSTGPSLRRAVTGFVETAPVLLLSVVLFTENVIWTWVVKATAIADAFGSRAIRFEIGHDYAWDTFLVIVAWAWCGWRLLIGDGRGEQGGEGGSGVWGSHERFADENGVDPRRG
jgi:hypothetical protein